MEGKKAPLERGEKKDLKMRDIETDVMGGGYGRDKREKETLAS